MRLFIAACLPEATRQQIERAVAPLRAALPAASWTKADSFHLTFAFLGNQRETIVESVSRDLSVRIAGFPRFEIVASGCGFFPNASRAHVAWIGLHPAEQLIRLAEEVRASLRSRSVEFDGKHYVPHLTLARLHARWSQGDMDRFTRVLGSFSTEPVPIDSVVIYKSQLSPKGAIHTALRTLTLA